MSRRVAWRRSVEPAFVFARLCPPIGPLAASLVLSTARLLDAIVERLRSP
jgi:hypothetical protein